MNTVRNIRIATGVKRIELNNENFAMLQIRDVLRQHREALINSLMSDLSTYVKYKFNALVKNDNLESIRTRLAALKNSDVSLSNYSEIVGEVLANEFTYIKSEPFYHEINSVIGEALNPSQLILVK